MEELPIGIQQGLAPIRYTLRFAHDVVPRVDRELVKWRERALRIEDGPLRKQALASIQSKRFHAEGGSVFVAAAPEASDLLIPLIVALQTISDYLDNLGDRTDSLDEKDFRCLHQAMLDAVNPTAVQNDYYAYHPFQRDGGYLASLVATCQECVAQLPHYDLVFSEVHRQLERYCDLQVYKHLPIPEREERLRRWHANHPDRHPELSWWEFAAACGSTLGVFVLFLEAARGTAPGRVERLSRVYFPWINGVHILLDYLIDLEEDRVEGDLNFVSYYQRPDVALDRMRGLIRRTISEVARLEEPALHQAVVEGLLGLYLTDRKVAEQKMGAFARRLISAATPRTWLIYLYCTLWRRWHKRP